MQFDVSYEPETQWDGPVPSTQLQLLPIFATQLRQGESCRITILGDSISEGYNASGFTGASPYQPAYPGLLADFLRSRYGVTISVTNLAKAGMNSEWGVNRTADVVASRPDLVILAFGMNDASGEVPATQFRLNTKQVVDQVRDACPKAEFLLVSGMSANPDWLFASPQLHHEYHEVLKAMAQEHIGFVDVMSAWDYMVRRKDFWSLTGNGLNHPNDFGFRLYRDCLATALISDLKSPIRLP